jgi:hypothetical protein
MRAHLRKVCGDDPAMWPRLESLGWDAPAGGTGTARVQAGGQTDEISDEEESDEPEEPPRRRRTSAADWPRTQTLTSLLLGGSGTLTATNTNLPSPVESSEPVPTEEPPDEADSQTTDVVIASPPQRRPTPAPESSRPLPDGARKGEPAPRAASPPVRRASITQAVRPLPPSRPMEVVPTSRRRIILGALFAVIGIAITTTVALVGTREPAEPHARQLTTDPRRAAGHDEPPLIDPLRDVAVPAAQPPVIAPPPPPPTPPAVALPPQKPAAPVHPAPKPVTKKARGPRPLR